MEAFEQGLVVCVLGGEGHFGGDGKQPQVTVRMHTRHETLFNTLVRLVPGSKLYGPYQHGGRSYFQWMVRGALLKDTLVPMLDALPLQHIDIHVYERYLDMKARYRL